MSTHRIIQFAAAGLAIAGACIIFYTSKPDNVELETVPAAAPKAAAAKPAVELKGDAVQAPVAKKVLPKDHRILLPDGSSMPVLNHAYGAPKMSWPKDRPMRPMSPASPPGSRRKALAWGSLRAFCTVCRVGSPWEGREVRRSC